MGSSDRRVPVSLRVPKSMDDWFELVSTKSIIVEGKTVTIRKNKSELYLQALEFALESAEIWLRNKPRV